MPTTPNIVLQVPNTGDQRDVWGQNAVNPNSTAIDGFFGGVVSVALSNVPYSLSAPAGSVAPSAGPFESQNAIIQLTGTLTADVTITLPLPGRQTIANFTTPAADQVVILRAAGVGQVVGIPDGAVTEVYNDGTNVRFLHGFGVWPGKQEFLAGFSVVPRWISQSTTPPYLLADGSIYNISAFPNLAKRFQSAFGGNGFTTFGVPDLRGRLPIMMDLGAGRITTAGSGIDGNTIGAVGGEQAHALTAVENGPHNHAITDPGHNHTFSGLVAGGQVQAGGGTSGIANTTVTVSTNPTGISIQNSGNGNAHNNVQPAQMTGIWLIKT